MNIQVVTDTTYNFRGKVIWGINTNGDVCFSWANNAICFYKNISNKLNRKREKEINLCKHYIENMTVYRNVSCNVYTNKNEDIYLITFVYGNGLSVYINKTNDNKIPCYFFSMILKE